MHIAFHSTAGGSAIFWVRHDGAGTPQLLLKSPNVVAPTSFFPMASVLHTSRQTTIQMIFGLFRWISLTAITPSRASRNNSCKRLSPRITGAVLFS